MIRYHEDDDTRMRQLLAALDDARTLAADMIEDNHPQERALAAARTLINAAISWIQSTA